MTLAELQTDAKAWAAERRELSAREAAHLDNGTRHPSPSEWEDSDDWAARIAWAVLEL